MKFKTRKITTNHFSGKSRNISMHPGELYEIMKRDEDTHFEIICNKTGRMFCRTRDDIKSSYIRCKIINAAGEYTDVVKSKVTSEDQITAIYAVVRFKI